MAMAPLLKLTGTKHGGTMAARYFGRGLSVDGPHISASGRTGGREETTCLLLGPLLISIAEENSPQVHGKENHQKDDDGGRCILVEAGLGA